MFTPQNATPNHLSNQKGAYTLEFSLAAFTLFAIIFFVINVSAYISYWSVLSKGAHNGINLATKMPDINKTQAQFVSLPSATTSPKARIEAAIKSLPLNSGLIGNSSQLTVKIFRPGDVSGAGLDEYPFPRNASDVGSAAQLMDRYPIIIEVSAPFNLPIPFFGPVTVTATASGFRDTAV